MQYLLRSILVFCLLMAVEVVMAQSGTLRGFVYDGESKEPMIYSTVYLKGTTIGSVTDINGYFSIPKIPAGNYSVVAQSIGYDSTSTEVEIKASKTVTVNLLIKEATVSLGEVEITAKRQEKTQETQISSITLDPTTIQRLPSVGGEADVAQYLQVLPGIVFTGDQGGQIYIRGGSSVQTLFLLDGMPIYNPFHSIGLFSVFETELIRNVEVMTGGFDAEYGNRTSAVVDVTTKDGNKERFEGKISASTFLAKGVLEGPLYKSKETGGGGSFILSSKGSYLNKTSPLIYSYANDQGELPYMFSDTYGKLTFSSNTGNKASIFGFHFRDKANFNSIADYDWKASGGGGKFIFIPSKSNVFISTRFNFSDYGISFKEGTEKPRTSSIKGFNVGMDFTYFIRNGEAKYGFDVTGFKTEFEFFNKLGSIIDQNQNTTELAAYFKYRKYFDHFVIEPSVRMQYYGALGEISLEPRLRMKWNVNSVFRIKTATGIYSQNLISTKSDRDIVNLFTGFLSGPEEVLTKTNGEDASSKLQRAAHLIGGVELDVTEWLEINAETYYIKFFQLININRNKLFPSDDNYLIENGASYGLDLSAKVDYKNFYLWASYSLAKVERYDGVQTYPPHFDRRHNLNLVGSYRFGPKLGWEASARFNAGTGFAFTQTQGFYEEIPIGSDGVNTDILTANGTPPSNVPGILYAQELNQGRLSNYFRVDLSMKKTFHISDNTKLEANVGVSNVFNRDNIFYFDRVRNTKVYQLPILPNAGVSLAF